MVQCGYGGVEVLERVLGKSADELAELVYPHDEPYSFGPLGPPIGRVPPLLTLMDWATHHVESGLVRLDARGRFSPAILLSFLDGCPFTGDKPWADTIDDQDVPSLLLNLQVSVQRNFSLRPGRFHRSWLESTTMVDRQILAEEMLIECCNWSRLVKDRGGEFLDSCAHTWKLVLLILRYNGQQWVDPMELTQIWLQGWDLYLVDWPRDEVPWDDPVVQELSKIVFTLIPWLLGYIDYRESDGFVRPTTMLHSRAAYL